MLLAEVVATSASVAATRSRLAKTAAMADLLARLDPDEWVAAVGFLTGDPRQSRLGVGWATVFGVEVPPADEPSLTIADLDVVLERLPSISGPGSMAARGDLLASVLGRATEHEQAFIRRLLVGELRQGALEGVMVEAIAKAAAVPAAAVRRASMLGGRLDQAAVAAFTGGEAALARIGLQVGRGIQPMLASTATDVADALDGLGLASVEWKLDGARVQVHRQGDDVTVFTRNLNDVTHRLPEVVAAVRGLPVSSVVLDGEVLGMREDERPGAFQDTMARFGADAGRAQVLRPWFFDCIHLDGRDLLGAPLHERIAALDGIAPALRIPGVLTADPEVAARVLAEALAAGHEGVMVKGADSPYEAGRRGKAWRKVKPVHTFDLVVLAVEWGSGRRRGWLSNLHLGALGPDGEPVMVGKTFKGMTDELLAWQTDRFLVLETSRSEHTVHVRPEQVVEIALDGVQRSTRYPGGVALRFARVVRYRDDKPASEADTIESLQAMLR
jgi:DNA ligase-1